MRNITDGGADRVRTCDLLIANETLYQLSYDPTNLERKDYANPPANGKLFSAGNDQLVVAAAPV